MIKKFQSEIYALVDEAFLFQFKNDHRQFMRNVYYKYYLSFCENYNRKPLSENEFYSNMHRRRIQIYQLCCPYCGTIDLLVKDKRYGNSHPNYCIHCGKGSFIHNIHFQLSRFMRIRNVNDIGLKTLQEKYPDKEKWLLGYECYQMQLIELASIIEVILRDCFESLIYMCNFGMKNDYISKIISKHTGNGFMNIDKANEHYKKAFNINIKGLLENATWNNLIDIVNLRNMMVHNNGMIDAHFKSTASYNRLQSKIIDDLFMLTDDEIEVYWNSVLDLLIQLSKVYIKRYLSDRNVVIANYYFNNGIPLHPQKHKLKSSE